MDTNEILSHIDSLLKESRLDEAEKYMKATLSDAEKSGRPDIMLTLYNELAGFYRDCGRFAEALESCRRSEELLEKMNIGGAQLASALLNSANACRAAGLYDESFDYYRRIYAILEEISAEKPLFASYYNNLALLYQETSNWQEAADCLKKALTLADDDTMNCTAVSVRGKVRELGSDMLPLLFEKNPYMLKIYPTEESRKALTVFQIYEGSGEWFDLSKKPIERDSFTFGGAEITESGYFVTDDCIRCGSCLSDCPQSCIELNGKAVIRQENCLHCGNCAEVCPVGAVIRR